MDELLYMQRVAYHLVSYSHVGKFALVLGGAALERGLHTRDESHLLVSFVCVTGGLILEKMRDSFMHRHLNELEELLAQQIETEDAK